MPLRYPTPHSCLLSQATAYVHFQRTPIPDEIYVAAPDEVGFVSTELTRALRSKALVGLGSLYPVSRVARSLMWNLDWQVSSACPLIEEAEIHPTLWSLQQVDLVRERLICRSRPVSSLYGVTASNADEVRSTVTENVGTDQHIETAFAFTEIRVRTAELFKIFPPRKTISIVPGIGLAESVGDSPDAQTRGGRPQKYPWDEFYAELIVRADLDSLPQSQAELLEQMAEWCLSNWGEEPALSLLKAKTARIYQHPRKRKRKG